MRPVLASIFLVNVGGMREPGCNEERQVDRKRKPGHPADARQQMLHRSQLDGHEPGRAYTQR
jgi:hypothetical protein